MNIITSKLKYSLSIIGFVSLFTGSTYGQAELKSIDEVIDGIDSLLGDIKAQQPAPSPIIKPKPIPYQFGDSTTDPVPFRVNDELMPDMFLEPKEEQILDPLLEQPLNLDDVNPSPEEDDLLLFPPLLLLRLIPRGGSSAFRVKNVLIDKLTRACAANAWSKTIIQLSNFCCL